MDIWSPLDCLALKAEKYFSLSIRALQIFLLIMISFTHLIPHCNQLGLRFNKNWSHMLFLTDNTIGEHDGIVRISTRY